MFSKRYLLIFLLFWLIANVVSAQEIRISKDINIRNYYSYDLVGKVNDRIILYRDQGFGKEVDVFDMEMVHKFHADINLEDKKAVVYDIVNLDTCFQILYSITGKDSIYVKSKKLNEKLQIIDSTTVLVKEKSALKRKLKFIKSEDCSKLAFYAPFNNGFLDVSLIENDSTHLVYNHLVDIGDLDPINELRITEIANSGTMFFLFDIDNNRFKREDHQSHLLKVTENSSTFSTITYQSKVSQDLILDHDNINNRLLLVGLYNEKDDNKSEGMFIVNVPSNQLLASYEIQLIPFSEQFVNEVDSKRRGNSNFLENFVLRNILFRQDGGILLFAEMNKIFSRRNPYQGAANISRDNYVRRGWTDYYHEDVLVMAYDFKNNLEWKKVLYKKQFSQDDDGIYSSYFLFKTPSRIKMLYNDEIKKNNTVSQYNLDPLGNSSRKSILSTDYQNLKLRFQSATQISSNTLLVPSESVYNLNIVKIEYQ